MHTRDTIVTLCMFLGVGLVALVPWVLYRRQIDRQLAQLKSEGILFDSGEVEMTFRLDNYRYRRFHARASSRTGIERAVVTQQRLQFVPVGKNTSGILDLGRDALERFIVEVKDGQLHLHSEDPLDATGKVDLRLAVADPAAWALALAKLGAKAD